MRTTAIKFAGAAAATLCAFLAAGPSSADERYAQRWFYASHNLLDPPSVDQLLALIKRAHQSGFNGMVFADYKLGILDKMPPAYFAQAERIKKAAAENQIEIIPAVFPIGYSSPLLAHDPNLAEGVPVTDVPFVVRRGEAVLLPEPSAHLANGDLERSQDNRFADFMLQDDPGKTTFVDHQVVHGGHSCLRIEDTSSEKPYRNYRLAQRVRVRPHACYRFSAWVKTRDLQPVSGFQMLARSAGLTHRPLTFFEPHLKPTQDWTQVEVAFNTLEESEVELYIGHWGAQAGTLWIDDLALDELALVNVLRREGCPLRVRSEDGKITYQEGTDYQEVRDVHLGQRPWAGEYDFLHAGPKLLLTPNSRIADGQRLKVSWYHPIITHGSQVTACLTERRVYDLLRQQAKAVNDLFRPNTFFMLHDEIRVANWCGSCQERHLSAGQLLADHVARCIRILKEINAAAKVVAWSDMFDPNHNAVDHYYLVRGSLSGSWSGLSNDVIIANWNIDRAAESLKWFAALGHPQIIAGYYDTSLDNYKKWDLAARGAPKINGFMYTTWQGKYGLLEVFGDALLHKDSSAR
jgi:hypothetical protein